MAYAYEVYCYYKCKCIGMLISRHQLKTPLLASLALFFLFGGTALLSRFRTSAFINVAFKFGIGTEYQSWFEHFLSGFSSTSLLFIFVVSFGALLSLGRQGNTNIRLFCRMRAYLLAQSERNLYTILLIFCTLAYIVISVSWEFNQFLEKGTFQFGQFACDSLGSIIWFLLLRQLYIKPS